MANLIEELRSEIKRSEELLEEYKSIPVGAFGAMMIRRTLDRANDALNSLDTPAMVKSLEELRGNQ